VTLDDRPPRHEEGKREVKLYELKQPQKWRAGHVGDKELFLDCGQCEAEAPVINFFSASGHDTKPNFSLLRHPHLNIRL